DEDGRGGPANRTPVRLHPQPRQHAEQHEDRQRRDESGEDPAVQRIVDLGPGHGALLFVGRYFTVNLTVSTTSGFKGRCFESATTAITRWGARFSESSDRKSRRLNSSQVAISYAVF